MSFAKLWVSVLISLTSPVMVAMCAFACLASRSSLPCGCPGLSCMTAKQHMRIPGLNRWPELPYPADAMWERWYDASLILCGTDGMTPPLSPLSSLSHLCHELLKSCCLFVILKLDCILYQSKLRPSQPIVASTEGMNVVQEAQYKVPWTSSCSLSACSLSALSFLC